MNVFSSTRILLLVLLSFAVANAKHSASTHCNVYDLLEDCKGAVVPLADKSGSTSLGELDTYLIDKCQSYSGMIVAKCLMKYLCENHGEKAVDVVRDCVVKVCPLGKRLRTEHVCPNKNRRHNFLR